MESRIAAFSPHNPEYFMHQGWHTIFIIYLLDPLTQRLAWLYMGVHIVGETYGSKQRTQKQLKKFPLLIDIGIRSRGVDFGAYSPPYPLSYIYNNVH